MPHDDLPRLAPLSAVPSVTEVFNRYQKHYDKLSKKFMSAVRENFERGVKHYQMEIVVHPNVEWEWQRDLLAETFLNRSVGMGYELTFYTKDDDTTDAIVHVPFPIDMSKKFQHVKSTSLALNVCDK